MENINMMNETFEMYYKKARSSFDRGDLVLAKRYFMLAAEQMLKMAKASTGALQVARYTRAKSLLDIASQLEVSTPPKESGNEKAGKKEQPSAKREPDPAPVPPPQSASPRVEPVPESSARETRPIQPNVPQSAAVPPALTPDPAVSSAPVSAEPQPSEVITPEEVLRELDGLVGLETAKRYLQGSANQIKVAQFRKERGLPYGGSPTNCFLFLGNEGVGKRTAARQLARLYKAYGVLSGGQVVEVNREALTDQYVGQSSVKTQEAVKRAIGGVLYVKDVHLMTDMRNFSSDREAFEALFYSINQYRENFVVVFSGEDVAAEKTVLSDPTFLAHCNPAVIRFPDYSAQELLSVFEYLCDQNQYILEGEARLSLQWHIADLVKNRERVPVNAHTIRKLYETVVARQSDRVARIFNPSQGDLTMILVCDLPFAPKKPEPEKVVPQVATASQGMTAAAAAAVLEGKGGSSAGKQPADKNDKKEEVPDAEKKVLEGGTNGAGGEFKFDWDSLPVINFDDIAGLNEVKEIVRVKVLLPLQHPEVFEGYVRKSGGGMLLYGPPGTGKTMIAAAIANEIGAKFCSVKPSDLLNQGAGNTEKAVRSLFAQARQFPCAVIYFDEMDSISPKSTKSQYAKQLRSEFLAQLQGIEEYGSKKDNILFLIAATNKPWDIDSAFIRPGRFGTRVYVGLPDAEARKYLINRRLNKIREKGVVSVDADVDVGHIVEATNGYNGADMTNFLDRVEEISALRGVKTGVKNITAEDFETALGQVCSSVQSEDIDRLLEWKNSNE